MDKKALNKLKGGLVVSSQAPDESPLCTPAVLGAMAVAAAGAGAQGLRLNSPAVVAWVRRRTKAPIIGIYKDYGYEVYITPTFAHAAKIARAGADIIAVDATFRRKDLKEFIDRIHGELGVFVAADVSNAEEGEWAYECGADMAGSTLSGYVGVKKPPTGPDLKLVAALARLKAGPVMAEGRYATPEQVKRALKAGAHCVCVGTAITRPDVLTKAFLP